MMQPDPIALIRGLCDGLIREPALTIDYPRWIEEQLAEASGLGESLTLPEPSDPAAELAAVHAVLDEFDPSARKPHETAGERTRRVILIYKAHRARGGIR